MEHQEILNLLHEPSDSRFVTRKWNIGQSNADCVVGNGIIYNTEVLKSNDAYILVRGDITVIASSCNSNII